MPSPASSKRKNLRVHGHARGELTVALWHLDLSPWGRRYFFFRPGVSTEPFAVHFDERFASQWFSVITRSAFFRTFFSFRPAKRAANNKNATQRLNNSFP
jgi:hypothetical protein